MSLSVSQWVDLIRLISDGEAVDASVTNRPLGDLGQRTQHLKDLLELISASEAIFIRGAAIAEEVEIGEPVYYNNLTVRFERALTALDYGAAESWGNPAKSSYCQGLLASRDTATVGDIITAGTLNDFNISAALKTGETDESGAYYLSSTEPGKIERTKNPAAPFVLYRNKESNSVYVSPGTSGGLSDHVHHRVQLTALPAGIPNDPDIGEKHDIIVADSTLPGWLPATDSVFDGTAPDGAIFGYNIAKDPELGRIFPPLPLDSYFLEVYGDGWGAGREYDSVVKVDVNGIWWMENDFGWAPWSVDYWNCIEPGVGSAATETADKPAPVQLQTGNGYVPYVPGSDICYNMSIYLWFTKLAAVTSNSVVASLTPKEGSAIKLKNCNLEDATTGHLTIDVDLNFGTEEDLVSGGIVLKQVDGDKFKRGWVAEGVKSSSPAISITGEHTDDAGYKHGNLIITYNDPDTNAKELDVLLTALDGAVEEETNDVIYLGFRPNRDSSYRGKIEVPVNGFESSTDYEMNLALWVLGTSAGTLPDLSISYTRIPYTATPANIPVAETGSFTLALSEVTVTQNQYAAVSSDAFDIEPGDTVFFTISRTASGPSDTYTGNVGFIRQKGVITPRLEE